MRQRQTQDCIRLVLPNTQCGIKRGIHERSRQESPKRCKRKMTLYPLCVICNTIRTGNASRICSDCYNRNNFSYDRTVLHCCPKLRKPIVIDTQHTKSCLSCGFKVHKMTIKPHRYYNLAIVGHFVPLFFMVLMISLTDIDQWHILYMGLPMHAATFFAALYLIAQNTVNWHRAISQEQLNWYRRK